MSIQLAGVLPPITTPFDIEGELDLGALEHNVRRYNEIGLTGYVVFGSNGEAAHLTSDERQQIFARVREAAKPGMTLIAGVNEASNRGAIAAVRQAADAGADAALVLTPYFYKRAMTQDALRRFFLDVAENSPIPLLAYNFPQNTGVTLEPATLAEIADHDKILGFKDSSGNAGALSTTLRLAPAGFQALVGNAGIYYPALQMGATGAILAIANVAPRACVELYQAALAGNQERARVLQRQLAQLAQVILTPFGVAGLKAAMGLAGYAGGAPRPPLYAVSGKDRQRIAEVLRQSSLLKS